MGLQLICCFNQVIPLITFRFSSNQVLISSFMVVDLVSVGDLGQCMHVNEVPALWVFNLYIASIK